MKLIALMRTHNSSWIIDETLKALAPAVDAIIIHDHNSKDDTVIKCMNHPKVIDLFITKDPTYHEGRDKSILLNLGKKYNPDWFLIMDDDEIINKDLNKILPILMEMKNKAFAFPLLYLWGSPDKVRIDNPWGKQLRTKLVRNTKGLYFDLKQCHCSPQHEGEEIGVSHPMIHYGYVDQKLIDKKLKLYQSFSEETNDMKMTDLEKAFVKKGKYCTVSEAVKRRIWE